jgi:hypothetical protein
MPPASRTISALNTTTAALVNARPEDAPMDDFTNVNPDEAGADSADAGNGIEDGPLVRFTAFASNRRLSKHYKRKADGDLETLSGTQFSSGGYYVCEIPAAGVTGPSILASVGQVIDKLSSKQAIGLGVPLNGTISGKIITKDQHEKGNTTAITRSLEHFGWPELGLLLLDGDDIEGLPEILSELYPPFAAVAVLVRPSASASVINPTTKQKLKAGEHCYVVIDDPSLSDACLKALMRLAWCRGSGKAAGWLKLSKSGAVLARGPVDACVGSPERLSYEGEAVIDDGISRLPRVSKVVGGTGMLCARDLVAFADRHAPEDQFHALVDEAKADPEFCERRDAAKVAYRGEHVAKAVKRGIPREKAEKAYDESIAAGSATTGTRTWLPLTDEHVLYTPGGDAFTIADIKKDPLKYNGTECADPIEGLDYQSKNCAIIYTNGQQIEIYSRAHGDAFAYVAPFDETPWAALLAQVMAEHATSPVVEIEDEEEAENTGNGSGTTTAGAAPSRPVTSMVGVTIHDFYAYMPKHLYIFAPTGEMWPAASINARLPRIPLKKKNGAPARDKDGKPKYIMPSRWLDRHRAVEQMTWAPGEPQTIVGQLVSDGGWIEREGVATFNLYRPPVVRPGNAGGAGRWIELVRRIYPDNATHIIAFCAHRIQRPAEKINHGLVLTGAPGIGKDTLLEPLKHGVGPWNFREVSPADITSTFNDFMRSVVLRVSEARDLGDINRYAFYESMKTITAAPPDVTRVNGKYIPQHYVVNVTGVILTTNYPQDGLYLPPDDRRHYVAGTEVTKDDFEADFWPSLWDWYRSGGLEDVVAYLAQYDLSKFDPKKPPEKTEAFWRMVDGGMAPEVPELRDVLDRLGEAQIAVAAVKAAEAGGKDLSPAEKKTIRKAAVEAAKQSGQLRPPAAVTLGMVMDAILQTGGDLYNWLKEHRNRRAIPHRLESCGYVPVRNSSAESGLWVIAGKRQVVYGVPRQHP